MNVRSSSRIKINCVVEISSEKIFPVLSHAILHASSFPFPPILKDKSEFPLRSKTEIKKSPFPFDVSESVPLPGSKSAVS